ncbi:hypothetical protein VTO42DRAFT_4136 [Malbranchea cinnamomea]
MLPYQLCLHVGVDILRIKVTTLADSGLPPGTSSPPYLDGHDDEVKTAAEVKLNASHSTQGLSIAADTIHNAKEKK